MSVRNAGNSILSANKRKLLERMLQQRDLSVRDRISRAATASSYPLSFGQQRMWFTDQWEPGNTAYNVPAAVGLRGEFSSSALEGALREIVRRHEVLRTRFEVRDGVPVQVVQPCEASWPLVEQVDLRASASAEQEVRRWMREEAGQPFDLAGGRLLRARLLQLAAEEHVLLLTMHHIASDGWSMGVLVSEIGALYNAFRMGEPSPLPELAIQYADYAVWQREHLSGELLETQLAYWQHQLKNVPVLEMPTDFARAAERSYQGASVPVEVEGETLDRLRDLARQQGVTLYMVLLASFQLVLAKWTGQDDIAVGTAIANRTRSEIEGLIGFFVNTLVLRTDLSGDPTVTDLLGRVRETSLGAYAHQDLPFERLVEALNPERSLNRTPLFQAMFTLQNAPFSDIQAGQLQVALLPPETEAVKIELDLTLHESANGLFGPMSYSTRLFSRGTIERLVQRWLTTLHEITVYPSQPISKISGLLPDERDGLLYGWNPADAPIPEASLDTLIAARCAEYKDGIAVRAGERFLTFGELNSRAAHLGASLRTHLKGPESKVAVLLETSIESVVAVLAILKAGAVYVPIDPAYASNRIGYLLQNSEACAAITSENLLDRLPAGTPHVLADSVVSVLEPLALPADSSPDRAAYMIYTSGSSGKPKGVLVTHGSVINLIAEFQKRAPLHVGDTCSLWTSPSFDVSIYELFAPLLSGATLQLPNSDIRLDADAFIEWMRDHEITSAYVPSFMLPRLAEWLDAGPFALRRLLVGVERIPSSLLRRIAASHPSLHVINGYGPTETTVCSTLYSISPNDSESSGPAPIGVPIANTGAYVLDAALEPVPIGSVGELYIGGAGLARGYAGNTSLTAAMFIPDCLTGTPGARLYRTGDRVRWLGSGVLEFQGRMDDQLKLRGYRIEPGEIEASLLEYPGVLQAVVILRRDDPQAEQLVAYLVLTPDCDATGSLLRGFLLRGIPAYMLPDFFIALNELPLTANGKVDRAALPAPDKSSANIFVAPQNPTEEIVSAIWRDVLGRDSISVDRSFFELGGHSLTATQVVSRIRSAFGVDLPLWTFFDTPTIRDVASAIHTTPAGDAGSTIPLLAPAGRKGDLPLSFAQLRLWAIHQINPGTTEYNVPIPLRLHGTLHKPALMRSFEQLVERHEILRTTFPAEDGLPRQRIAAELRLPVEEIDLTGLSEAEREQHARRILETELATGFNLATGPLFRIKLIIGSEDDHVLLLTLHHMVTDAWSMRVLVAEFAELYDASVSDRPHRLPELSLQYADYAAWQRNWLQGETYTTQLDYWKDQLRDVHMLDLPLDRPRSGAGRDSREVRIELSTELTERLEALCCRQSVTLFMLLVASLDVLLYRWTGQTDLALGTPIANRHRRETEPLVGFFVNTLVLRTDVSANPNFLDLLAQVRKTTLDAYSHQDFPIEKLVETIKPDRDASRTPLFQVLFALQNIAAPALQLGDVTLTTIETGASTSFDLSISLAQSTEGRGLAGSFVYDGSLFDPETIRLLTSRWLNLLQGLAANPDQTTSALDLLSAYEKAEIVRFSNQAPSSAAAHACIHDLFLRQVERSPHSIAVEFEGHEFTYLQLDEQANRVASHLLQSGLKPETRVGVCLERSFDLIVAMLAVLKAGGVYVPLDPRFPPERLRFAAEDAGLHLSLTSREDAFALAGWSGPTVFIDAARASDADLIALQSVDVIPASGAYVIYTSGSTGRPKGVAVTHANVARLLASTQAWFGFSDRDTWTMFHSPSFDFSVWEIWGALLNGGRLVVVPYWVTRSPKDFFELTQKANVTILNQTPSAFYSFVEASGSTHAQPSALRCVIFGGEALDVGKLRPWFDRHGDTSPTLVNMYGITETTVHVTYFPIDAPAADAVPRNVIGRPIPDLETYVLDRDLNLLPIGAPGELYVGGEGLARGYLDRPDLTAERFLPNLFSRSAGARLYRTGDRVRWNADGSLEFLGRLDSQVKLRGFRIELGEIEAALNACDGVRECVVLLRESSNNDRRLVAYVTTEPSDDVSSASLRNRLHDTLPEYMIPSGFFFLNSLPLTAQGKIDRRALAARKDLQAAGGSSFVAPRTPIEEMLAGIWREILMIPRVGVHDNFFELGGHSLTMIQLAARIRAAFYVDIPIRVLFDAPTLSAVIDAIAAAQAAKTQPAEIDELLDELDGLSDAEINALLEKEMAGGAN